MTGLFSRVAVALIGLPLVLGAVWAGGWWLFALVTAAATIAVHEFVTMARPLRPLTPAVYVGTVLGAAWIGFGLGHLILLRDMDDKARLLAVTVVLTVFAADTFAYFGGRMI